MKSTHLNLAYEAKSSATGSLESERFIGLTVLSGAITSGDFFFINSKYIFFKFRSRHNLLSSDRKMRLAISNELPKPLGPDLNESLT